jgi:hypothetical protein
MVLSRVLTLFDCNVVTLWRVFFFFFLVYTLNDRLILVGRFGRIMPFLVVSTILSGLQYYLFSP